MKKMIAAFIILVFALVVVTMVVSYYKFRKSLPKTTGEIKVEGLRENVEIYRDDNGVPHIYAQNDDDLYFSLGFAIAQDRLWQLELVRRLVNGRLSEILGDTTVSVDEFFLTIGFKRIAGEIYGQLSEESKAVARAYTQGINHFIDTHGDKYPVEFMLLNFEPEPWHPEDCIAVSRLMAWELSLAWYVELLAGKLADKLGRTRANELFGDYWSDWPNIVNSKLGRFDLDPIRKLQEQIAGLTGSTLSGQGSNNWVISGTKSASGKPILANDPHLVLANPSRWYMVHLNAPGINAAGFAIPGTPAIVIGFNQRISWGITNVMNDDVDFFVVRANRYDSTKYLVNGTWEEMTAIIETIPVKGGEPKRVAIHLTKFGPIVNAIHPVGKKMEERVALRWTGQEFSDDIRAFYHLNRSGSWPEFREAVRGFKAPGANFVYADVDGNIGYQCSGYIPIRASRSAAFPDRSGRDWRGFIPFEELPSSYNPTRAFLATANNRVASTGYPYYISHLWEPPSRIMRIRELLERDKAFSVDDFKAMQMDVRSPFAEFLLPHILPELKILADRAENFRRMYQFMQGWEMQVRGESVAAAIFHTFFSNFLRNTFADELGEDDFEEYVRFAALSYRTVRKVYERRLFHWFDDVNTEGNTETEENSVLRSWQDAAHELESKLGSDQIKWRWDLIHSVTFKHFIGKQPMIGRLLNVGPLPMGGGHTTINNGNYSLKDPYDCMVGPSMRMIVDMAQPGRAHVINPPGQVGHPLSRHFRDQVEFWLNGLYTTLDTDEKIIHNSGYDRLILKVANHQKEEGTE